ncbi:MAG TPA: hypothetical protein PKC78_10580 [Accumulibacter sp.]|uniref:hypothetical protein n=1 Tax=Accumulibacter sp. TaxID=2053492 RepID=UPI002CDB195B|nr:hypothetical protein [Accumulibacter sp.]HMW80804.1 hypothetical protein [Accumulibacter sp.]
MEIPMAQRIAHVAHAAVGIAVEGGITSRRNALATVFMVVVSLAKPLLSWTVGWSPSSGVEFGGSAAIICIGVVAWRVLQIRRLCRQGREFSGRVTRVQRVKDRARIDFEYHDRTCSHMAWHGMATRACNSPGQSNHRRAPGSGTCIAR